MPDPLQAGGAYRKITPVSLLGAFLPVDAGALSRVSRVQTGRRRLIEIQSPNPRTARDELGQTRLGEVDGVIAANELGGVRRASAWVKLLV